MTSSRTYFDTVLDILDVIFWLDKQRMYFVKEDLHLKGPVVTPPYFRLHTQS
jgi:hypothetical protein